MSETLQITMAKSELEEWWRQIKSVMPPSVQYIDGDPEAMLRAAYVKRGDILDYLSQRIAAMPGMKY